MVVVNTCDEPGNIKWIAALAPTERQVSCSGAVVARSDNEQSGALSVRREGARCRRQCMHSTCGGACQACRLRDSGCGYRHCLHEWKYGLMSGVVLGAGMLDRLTRTGMMIHEAFRLDEIKIAGRQARAVIGGRDNGKIKYKAGESGTTRAVNFDIAAFGPGLEVSGS
jgi:hypothetical protein